ncbi:DUF4124 domain-containing protein [Ferrimonas lipolytica]|uniref:DUF4124 domain-containing protein n=1 Tax=Ferrimonas lipolytica TaxID=2724191 RepID=A0A6H1UGU7_9GAMM|nr:DUF4124 domain-containing protein [Ferrimonas lipolytica]QIZ78311.1 DUF4124 domain-containing protein [Ferrimonas lipolytica]
MKLRVLMLLLLALPASAEIYKWVDADGKIHYGDKPVAGAEKVVPKEPMTATLSRAPTTPTQTQQPQTSPAQQRISYKVKFTAPDNNATVRNNNGQVPVSIFLKPELASNHRLQLFLDGSVIRTLGGGGNFVLDDIDRGEHQLQVKVIDKSGKILAYSSKRTLFMHRQSLLMPSGSKPIVKIPHN